MLFLLTIIPVALFLNTVGSLAYWIAFKCSGTQVKEFKIGTGSSVLSFQLLGVTINLCRYPIGSSITCDIDEFLLKPKSIFILVHVSAMAALLLLSAALLRYDEAFYHFVSGFRQILEGAWSPRSQGVHLIRRFVAVSESSPSVFFGILAAKFAALDALPLGGAGAKIFSELLWKREGRARDIMLTSGALLGFAVFISWSIAICLYAFGN
jgi:hypothetical protein